MNRLVRPFRLSRRACLKSAVACIALPWLEVHESLAQSGSKPLRFATIFAPNGIRMDRYKPSGTGTDWQLSPILEPLASVKSEVNVISGLANYPASVTPERWAGSHARATGALLTQTPLAFTSGSNIDNGISLDQMLAQEIGHQTALPSIELGMREGSASGNCEDGYSCAYLHNLSWSGRTTPMKKIASPRRAFERLFENFMPDGAAPDVAPPRNYDASILDSVHTRVQSLNQHLGATDRAKLDEYLTAVRSVEQRLEQAPTVSWIACEPGTAPSDGQEYPNHIRAMMDLILLAFACDRTRVVTFMLEDALNTPARYGFLGVNGRFHEISHHGRDPDKLNDIETINRWEIEQFAYLIEGLQAIEEEGESLLDRSFLLFTSEFGDGDAHYHWDLPMITAGRAGGYLTTGQHIDYPMRSRSRPEPDLADQPMANLFLNVLEAFGIQRDTFGTTGEEPYGTQPLEELRA